MGADKMRKIYNQWFVIQFNIMKKIFKFSLTIKYISG